jgi:hypothetical protein
MSSTADTLAAHPIVDFTARLHARLDGLATVPAWSLSPDETRGVLVDLARGQARLEALRLRVLAAGDRADIAAASAATSTGAWLAHAPAPPAASRTATSSWPPPSTRRWPRPGTRWPPGWSTGSRRG